MTAKPFEAFSLSHACILDGTTGAEAANGQIYGCRTGSISVNTGTFDNTGDDSVLSTWIWFDYATVTVDAGYISYDLISLITGSPSASSGTAPNDYYTTPIWTRGSLNQSPKPMLIRTLSKDTSKNIRTQDFVLYSVQFNPINFTGPAYKTGMTCSYSGKALISSVDEVGNTLTEPAIGRLVNSPGQLQGAVTKPYGEGVTN